MTRYLLAGGGTAGHVNPLLALAEFIKKTESGSEIYVLGTAEGLESRLVPERGFELLTIPRLPFPRKPSVYALKFPGAYFKTVKNVKNLLKDKNIDVVVGFGGYASAPAYAAAKRAGIPYVIHEANARPGLANIFGAKKAAAVAVTFPDTPIKNRVVTGMPLRSEIETLNVAETRVAARKYFGLQTNTPTIVVTGGSLGARAINEAITKSAKLLISEGFQILHIWGSLTKVQDPGIEGYKIIEYCDRMDYAFAASNLMISRAGATAVSEISGLGIPAVFVPYRSGNGEQQKNAQSVVEAGGAFLVDEREITPDWVQNNLLPLLSDESALNEMSKNALRVGSLNGTEQLYDLIQEVK